MKYIAIILLYLFLCYSVSTAQESITKCLGYTDTYWDTIQGFNVWYGYEADEPWGIPDDAEIVAWIRLDNIVWGKRLIILESKQTDYFQYAMPFITMKPQGIPYGSHPCGLFKFRKENYAK